MSNLPLPVIALVLVFAFAVAGGLYVILVERQRRAVVRRAAGDVPAEYFRRESPKRGVGQGLVDWLAARVPVQFGENTAVASKLVQAGFDGATAASMYGLIRIACGVTIPLLALLLAPRESAFFLPTLFIGIVIGLLGPQAALDRLGARRQDVIRKGIPDALDLLVVCVEAGVALDAAVQRVARELVTVHPILSEELVGMSRRISAGMAREQAMQGLYLRTGLDELRGLASHMLQSERWGTSIASVLR
ncbi:MAG TPA: type II secretion system F family protein, partial [Gemmatimonas sp.]|nr:type II secretion system F family protein [Gemmatimonas sp.]